MIDTESLLNSLAEGVVSDTSAKTGLFEGAEIFIPVSDTHRQVLRWGAQAR